MCYEVVRVFSGPEGPMLPGTMLEETAFRPRNLRSLLDRRFLRAVPVVERAPQAQPPAHFDQRRGGR